MGFILDTAPAVEPVTVAELTTHLRISDIALDDELTRLIKAARQSVEALLKRQLITATYKAYYDYWPPCVFELPMPPLQSVTTIKYYDTAGVQQTWSASNYQVDTTGVHGTITPAYNVVYPVLQLGKKNAIEIEFDAGYGDAADDVPECIKQAILSLAGHWFENPLPVSLGQAIIELPDHIKWMLEPEMVAEVY